MYSYYCNISIRKVILLGYKVLKLKIISIGKLSLGSFKESDFKLFNKSVFQYLRL